jgi:hypothetical protein
MAYYVVKEFTDGIDRRRNQAAIHDRALWMIRNGHVTPGGDIERAPKWVRAKDAFIAPSYNILTGTTGLASRDDAIFAFGKGTTPPSGFTEYNPASPPSSIDPYGLYWQSLKRNTAGPPVVDYIEFIDAELYNGAFALSYVWFEPNGTKHHDYKWELYTEELGGWFSHARSLQTFEGKVHRLRPDGRLEFSATDDATEWDPTIPDGGGGVIETGAGYVILPNYVGARTPFVGMEPYYDQLAIFSGASTQLWSIATDPRENKQLQVLRGVGTRAKRSIRQYADGDVLFLSSYGIRSLRARNASNAASVTDVGSPIDALVREDMRLMSQDEFEQSIALVHPITGQLMVCVSDKVYVLSYYPGPGVSAWSIYDAPDPSGIPAAIWQGCEVGNSLAVRSESELYLLGGTSGYTYGSSGLGNGMEIVTPFYTAGEPATRKAFSGLDVLGEGTFDVQVCFDPENPTNWIQVGTAIPACTVGREEGAIPLEGESTHIAFRLRSTNAGYAQLSQLIFHYDKTYAS